jgi:hypothetical protein
LQRIIEDMYISRDAVNLEDLEALSHRYEYLFYFLRGYFKSANKIEVPEDGALVLPFVPGVEHTSLLQCLSLECSKYVIDLRDVELNDGFLKSVLNCLDGKVYIVSDRIYGDPDEIIVGNIDARVLRSISHEPYNLMKRVLKLRDGRYRPFGDAPEFHKEMKSRITYNHHEPLDLIDKVFKNYSRDVENILVEIWDTGNIIESNLLERLMEAFNEEYTSKVVLYLLLKHKLLDYVNSPAGRQYMISPRGMRTILLRFRMAGEPNEQTR